MANKKKIKPVTLRESIYEQNYRLKQEAKELLKKIKENEKINIIIVTCMLWMF
jgi:hypothetical protein